MTRWVGHDAAERTLLSAFQSRRLHHGWLLAGPQGLGKAGFAQRAAAHLLTREPDDQSECFAPRMDSAAGRLLAEGHHPDCHWLTPGPRDDKEMRKMERGEAYEVARNIRIDQVRELQRRLAVRPSLAPRRVIVFDSVDLLERSGANALLKSLEEPPADTIFLLVAHNPGKLLPTIRSRCQLLRFAPLEDEAMLDVLRAARPGLSDGEYRALARLGQGAPGQALAYAGLGMDRVDTLLAQIADTGDPQQRGRAALAAMMAGKAQKELFQALLHYAPSFAAARLRGQGEGPDPAGIEARRAMIDLANRSVTLNLDPQAVAFQIGGLLARLAPPR